MPESKNPTINDVARAAKVGASTVSRYVRGGKSVSERLAQRIEAAIAQLGYEPNTLARGLRIGRTYTLGVIFPHVNNIFYGNALRVIQAEVHRRGFTVMLLTHQEDTDLQQDQLSSLKRSRVDGLILIPAAGTVADRVQQIVGNTPVVTIDRILSPAFDSVTLYNRIAGRQATEHLLWHKHRRIIAVTSPYKLEPLRARLRGHQDAMSDAGLEIETIVLQSPEQLKHDLGLAFTRKRSPATAVLSTSYSVTIAILGVLYACQIPLRNIGFIGIDDLEFARFVDPPLTTVAQPAEHFAQIAVEQLLRRIQGSSERPARVALPGVLTIRSSCGCNVPTS